MGVGLVAIGSGTSVMAKHFQSEYCFKGNTRVPIDGNHQEHYLSIRRERFTKIWDVIEV
jgi:hypothetical protein